MTGCSAGSTDSSEGSAENGFDQTNLVVAGTLPTNTAMMEGAQRFIDAMGEESDGTVGAELYSDGQLGGEPEMIEGLQLGTVDIAMVGAPLIATYCPKLGATSLPYVIEGDTPEEQYNNLRKLTDRGVNDAAIDECAETQGLRVIDDSWWYGNRHVTSNVPIEEPADLAGLRIRTPEGDLHADPFAVLGAEPVPMAQSEVYTSLETGVIDGQENPFATTYKHAFQEVQDYLNLTGLMTHNQVLVMSEQDFQALSGETQQLLIESVREAGIWQSEEQMAQNEELSQTLQDEGMELVESDRDAFRAATEDYVTSYFETHDISREDFKTAQE